MYIPCMVCVFVCGHIMYHVHVDGVCVGFGPYPDLADSVVSGAV